VKKNEKLRGGWERKTIKCRVKYQVSKRRRGGREYWEGGGQKKGMSRGSEKGEKGVHRYPFYLLPSKEEGNRRNRKEALLRKRKGTGKKGNRLRGFARKNNSKKKKAMGKEDWKGADGKLNNQGIHLDVASGKKREGYRGGKKEEFRKGRKTGSKRAEGEKGMSKKVFASG